MHCARAGLGRRRTGRRLQRRPGPVAGCLQISEILHALGQVQAEAALGGTGNRGAAGDPHLADHGADRVGYIRVLRHRVLGSGKRGDRRVIGRGRGTEPDQRRPKREGRPHEPRMAIERRLGQEAAAGFGLLEPVLRKGGVQHHLSRAPGQGVDDPPAELLGILGHPFAVIAALAGKQPRRLLGRHPVPGIVQTQHMGRVRGGERRDHHQPSRHQFPERSSVKPGA